MVLSVRNTVFPKMDSIADFFLFIVGFLSYENGQYYVFFFCLLLVFLPDDEYMQEVYSNLFQYDHKNGIFHCSFANSLFFRYSSVLRGTEICSFPVPFLFLFLCPG